MSRTCTRSSLPRVSSTYPRKSRPTSFLSSVRLNYYTLLFLQVFVDKLRLLLLIRFKNKYPMSNWFEWSQDFGWMKLWIWILLIVAGILNTIGEVMVGWVGDQSWVSTPLLYAACMACCAVSTALMPLIDSYPLLLGEQFRKFRKEY